MTQRLFAVYLGGRAARCNTELHDVVFVVGASIEATYHPLIDKWFGDPLRLHIDSWLELSQVDGYRVVLKPEPSRSAGVCRPARVASYFGALMPACGPMIMVVLRVSASRSVGTAHHFFRLRFSSAVR